MKTAVLAIVGILALPGLSAAADANPPGGANPANPFALSSDIPDPQPSLKLPGDDESIPFLLAHRNDEVRYVTYYLGHYRVGGPSWGPGYSHLPRSVDAQGRPLWFDHGYGDNLLNNLVWMLFQNEQFLDLERVFGDWSDPSARLADGRPMLMAYAGALEANLAHTLDWDAIHEKIQRWRSKNPYAPAAAITEAIYWQHYAWNARGEGSAASVTPDGWKLFDERLRKAQAVLEESRSFASDNPLWDLTYIDVGVGLNWPKDQLLRRLAESVAKHPAFSSLYTTTAYYLAPQWGGGWDLVDQIARDAVRNTEAAEGWSYYARIYMSVDYCCNELDLFRDTQANWQDMKHGFEDLIRLYPHSAWNMNRFAAFACVADDKDAYVSLRFKLGKLIMPTAWPYNHSFDLCEHKFAPARL